MNREAVAACLRLGIYVPLADLRHDSDQRLVALIRASECREILELACRYYPDLRCDVTINNFLNRLSAIASADTHPKDGDAKQAPLVSGAVPKADAHD